VRIIYDYSLVIIGGMAHQISGVKLEIVVKIAAMGYRQIYMSELWKKEILLVAWFMIGVLKNFILRNF